MDTNGKVKTGMLGAIALAVLVLSIVTMAVSISVRNDLQRISSLDMAAVAANGTPSQVQEDEPQGDAAEVPIYVLRLDGGGLGVCDPSGAVLRHVECHAAFLPQADREALTRGIAVFSEEELFSLIEDFTG